MSVTVAFVNQKGGVGKTTSAINVAASLGLRGKRTLLCDLDPQANATSGVGVGKRSFSLSAYDALIGRCPSAEAVVRTKFDNLWLLPSNINLAGAEVEFAAGNASDRAFSLKKALEPLAGEYDYIIIDCPPSLGILTLNALCAADFAVVAMQCEFFALEGLAGLTATIRKVKAELNPKLELAGILVTMFDGRLNLSLQVIEELKKHFPGKLFKAIVPRTVRLSEAPSHGMPIYYYDKNTRAAECYISIADELADFTSPHAGAEPLR